MPHICLSEVLSLTAPQTIAMWKFPHMGNLCFSQFSLCRIPVTMVSLNNTSFPTTQFRPQYHHTLTMSNYIKYQLCYFFSPEITMQVRVGHTTVTNRFTSFSLSDDESLRVCHSVHLDSKACSSAASLSNSGK